MGWETHLWERQLAEFAICVWGHGVGLNATSPEQQVSGACAIIWQRGCARTCIGVADLNRKVLAAE